MVSRRFYALLFFLSAAIFACQLGGVVNERATVTAGPIAPTITPGPTATTMNTPTPFPSPTAMPTATLSPTLASSTPIQPLPTEPPNYASLMIFTGDLPAGYLPAPEIDELPQVGEFFDSLTDVRSVFLYGHPETAESIYGFTTLLPTIFAQNNFDQSLHLQMFRYRLLGSNAEVTEVTGAETVGDASVLLTAELDVKGVPYYGHCAAFRQDTIGAVVCYVYPRTREPLTSAIELAQLLDRRIMLLLGSD